MSEISEGVPTTDDVRGGYALGEYSPDQYPWKSYEQGEVEFDRWLNQVKAEAWDQGWEAAYGMAKGWGHVDWWEDPWPENPYV